MFVPPPRAFARRARRAAAALAFSAVALGASAAGADILPDGMKKITATYEVTGIAEHPDYLFVAFPYGACEIDPEFYKLNPEHDKATHNYEVLRPGQKYETQKFCFNSKLYAFKASGFKTAPLVLSEAIDFVRREGYSFTVINGFDELKTTEKVKLVASDARVKSSSLTLSFPLFVSDSLPIASTHDVLRVVSVGDDGVKTEGVKVVLGLQGGETKEVPYKDGKRPDEAGALKEAPPMELPKTPASASAKAPPSAPTTAPALTPANTEGSGAMTYALAGAGALGAVLLGIALLRRGRSDKK